jgi:hypothetical protein
MGDMSGTDRSGMSAFQRSIHLIIAGAVIIPLWAMMIGEGNRPNGAFFVFAALPSIVGLLHHVSQGRRFEKGKAELKERGAKSQVEGVHRFEPNSYTAISSCLTLYAVFLVGALLATAVTNAPAPAAIDAAKPAVSSPTGDGLHALTLAGFGAYVSVLWYMLGRINANALTSRFIVNSTLKVAAAMVIGYVAGYVNMFDSPTTTLAQTGFFLIGMFQAFAMNFLRRKAVEIFGIKQAAAEELPLSLIQGMDDSAADLLAENGITNVQHLATTDPIELSFRTLYPLDRALDWVDEAMLILEFGAGRIEALREMQIRTVTGYVLVYRAASGDDAELKKAADETLTALAQKMGLPVSSLLLKGELLERNHVIDVIESLWNKPRPKDDEEPSKQGEVKISTPSLVTEPDAPPRPVQQQ